MSGTQPFPAQTQRIRSAIYDYFIEHGRAPSPSELAGAISVSVIQVEEAWRELAAGHAIVLTPGQRRIWMAPPLSAIPTRHRVRVGEHQWWAPCMWDALGIVAMLGTDGHVITECPYSRATLEVTVNRGTLLPCDGAVHFLVPAADWWTDIGFT